MKILSTSIFLIFVQFWASQNPKFYFTIHGMWPEYYNNTYPSYCNHSAHFNLSKIQYLEPILNVEWVSYEGSNPSFWKHEYLKHATCFPGVSEEQFFLDVLHLFDQTGSNQIFEKKKLNTNQTYQKITMNNYFNGTFQCHSHSNQTSELSSSVSELWRCYNTNLEQFKCPDWIDHSCGDQIVFWSNQSRTI